jgi:hypothetical protein
MIPHTPAECEGISKKEQTAFDLVSSIRWRDSVTQGIDRSRWPGSFPSRSPRQSTSPLRKSKTALIRDV